MKSLCTLAERSHSIIKAPTFKVPTNPRLEDTT
jgi:hypothetical protein